MNRRIFFLVMLVPLAAILSLIIYSYSTYYFGEEILLKTAPVDPRDIFRGDYVHLNYEVSTINLTQIPYDRYFNYGEDIYAVLSRGEKFWSVSKVEHNKPALREGEVCMRGTVVNSFNYRLTAAWGIESYFVPEGKGRAIEQELRDISVKIAVDSSCRAVIKELYLNGEPVSSEK